VRDAKRLQDDLAGRADASEYGFDHTPAERAACRNAAAKLLAVLTTTTTHRG
jgi:hypothetical protein